MPNAYINLLKIAFQDVRKQRGRLLLFVSSIILGIAALVSINTFSENLRHDIDAQAKDLLGADMVVDGNQPAAGATATLLDSIGGNRSEMISFISMALFPQTGATRLAQIKAIRGKYPFYGDFKTEPENAATSLQSGKNVLLDKTLMLQFNLHQGDSVKVGDFIYQIAGQVNAAPGRAGLAASIAPSIYMPLSALDSTSLLQRGSRVDYQYNFQFDDKRNVETLAKNLKPRLDAQKLNIETVEGRKQNTGDNFNNLAVFLNLVGFIALLLGCIGVASAINIYIKDKLSTVAILRTLGASGRQAFLIYLAQVTVMAALGSIAGAILGTAIQKILPYILKDFLPLDNISTHISPSAIAQGVFSGLSISLLFALLPLLAIRKTSPLRTLRTDFEEPETKQRDWLRLGVFALIGVFTFGFASLQTHSFKSGFTFIIGVGFALLLLAGAARGLMYILRRFLPSTWSYSARQGIANLYRPNNQTVTLIVAIGLGTMLISTLLLTQHNLLKQVSFAGSGNKPNMILFDIQPPQKDSVHDLITKAGMPILQQVPIITIRLEDIDGVSRAAYKKDTTDHHSPDHIPGWVYEREYRVTYRDTLTDSETMQEGALPPNHRLPDGTIGVTLSDRLSENMHGKVGTKISFNVQGVLYHCTVTGIRKVDFNRVQTNFLVLFPTGFLEAAPQFYTLVTRVNSEKQSADIQQSLVKRFPSISVVDLTQILKTLDEVLSKVSFAIRFMAMFSILTGIVVLISSIILSKYQRIRESVLLRSLGASRRRLLSINAYEYLFLGGLASFTGVLLSVVSVWLLARFSFKIPFSVDIASLMEIPVLITLMVVGIGLLNSREVLNKSPLEVLRAEI